MLLRPKSTILMFLLWSRSKFSGFRSLQIEGRMLPVDNIQAVNVLNASYDLLEELACFDLLHSAVLHDIVEQFAPTRIFHNQVELFGCFDDLAKSSLTS